MLKTRSVGLAFGGLAVLLGAAAECGPQERSEPPMAIFRGGLEMGASVVGGRFALVDTLMADVHVEARVLAVGGSRYAYRIAQNPASIGQIDYVAIGPLRSRPVRMESPAHWRARTVEDEEGLWIVWEPSESGSPPAGWIDDGVSTYASNYSIGPGGALSGFSIHMAEDLDPSAMATIRLRVYEEPTGAEEEEAPTCAAGASGRIAGPGR